RPAVQSSDLSTVIDLESELRSDYHLVPKWSESLAHEFFVGERAVHLGGIEEGDAALQRRPNQRDPLLLLHRPAIGRTQPHTAKAHSRNFQIARSKSAFFHCSSSHLKQLQPASLGILSPMPELLLLSFVILRLPKRLP